VEQILNQYEVRDSVISGLPLLNEEGVWIGNRDAYDGDILTDADLQGVAIERLLKLGSIALVSEAPVLTVVEGGQSEPPTEREVLNAMTKATLAGVANAEAVEIKGMSKPQMVDAILDARAKAAEEAAQAALDAAREAEEEAIRLAEEAAQAEALANAEDTEEVENPDDTGVDPRSGLGEQTDEQLRELAIAAGIDPDQLSREDLIEAIAQAWDKAAQGAVAESLETGAQD
jgi:hypothetical protein